MNTQVKFSTEIQPNDISNVISKNYSNTITDFFELQRVWLFRAYSVFNDLDKYLILISLISKTFKSYSEYFIKYDFDQFYSVNQYELKKFNIVEIARELSISKETARRKILELEKKGLIIKNKKAINIQRLAYSIKKPNDSIVIISKFMSSLSKLLKKNKIILNEISAINFESLIKKNFTQCWNYFLIFQIEYLTESKKKFFDDYETLSVWGVIVYNQNLVLNKKIKSGSQVMENLKDKYIEEMLSLKGNLGLNAMTISELTGIPRPTVIRKLNKLIKKKWIARNKNGLYLVSSSVKNYKDFNELRLNNINKISTMACKFFNTATLYE